MYLHDSFTSKPVSLFTTPRINTDKHGAKNVKVKKSLVIACCTPRYRKKRTSLNRKLRRNVSHTYIKCIFNSTSLLCCAQFGVFTRSCTLLCYFPPTSNFSVSLVCSYLTESLYRLQLVVLGCFVCI